MDIPGEPAPWLHRHPSEQRLRSYYGPVRQRAPRRYSMPSVSASARSLSQPRASAPGVAVSTLAFSRSVQEPQTRLTPPLRRTPPGQERGHPPGSSRGMHQNPRFRCHLKEFRRLNSARPTRALPDRALLERLPGPHLTRSPPRLFPGRLPRQSSANAAPGRFDARPRRADAGGPTILHLSHSSAYVRGLLHDSSFSVRDTRCGSNGVTSECPDLLVIRETGRRQCLAFASVRALWRPGRG